MASPNFAKAIPHGLADLRKLLLFYGERRHDDNGIAQRTNEASPIAGGHAASPTDGVGWRKGLSCRSVSYQFEPDHEALLPDFSNPGMISEKLVQERCKKSGSLAYALQDRLLFKDPQARHGGGATTG